MAGRTKRSCRSTPTAETAAIETIEQSMSTSGGSHHSLSSLRRQKQTPKRSLTQLTISLASLLRNDARAEQSLALKMTSTDDVAGWYCTHDWHECLCPRSSTGYSGTTPCRTAAHCLPRMEGVVPDINISVSISIRKATARPHSDRRTRHSACRRARTG